MNDDFVQKMKEKLLKELISHMDDRMGGDLEGHFAPKKSLEVSVAAPDKAALADGLEHAKELTDPDGDGDDDSGEGDDSDGDSSGDSDEDRLMALLGQDDDEDDDSRGA